MSSRNFMDILLNPFEDITSRNLLITGVLGFLLLSVLGYFLHFVNDGIINIHTSYPKEYWKYLVNGAINTGSLALLMYIYSLFVYPKARFQDIITAVLISQCALIIVVLLNFNPFSREILGGVIKQVENGNINDLKIEANSMILLSVLGLISVLFLYYFFHLLVMGMKIAINSHKVVHTIIIVLLTLSLDVFLHIVYPYL